MDLSQTLAQLSMIPGPSGFEGKVAEHARFLLENLMDEAYLDRFGNAIGVKRCGKEGARRLLLDAHLDEVGLLVTGMEDGFLRVRSIGGVDTRILPNQNLLILTEPVRHGLVACLPPHVQTATEQNTAVPLEELWIDVGLSQEQAETMIPIGTPVVYNSGFSELQNGFVAGKALDDRAGFATLLRAAELLKEEALDVDLYIMGSTREEFNGGGAAVGTFALEPDCCIAVDVTHGRTPDAPKEDTFPLGKGPVIGIGPNMTRWMSRRLIDKAEELKFSWQPEVMAGNTGTNAWKMQITREGIATGVLSIPLKYMHTPYEVLKTNDIEDAARLLAAFAKNLGREGGWS